MEDGIQDPDPPSLDVSISAAPEVGMKFDSFEDVEQFIQEYEENNFVKYFKNDSRTIRNARKRLPKRRMEERLKYHSVTFCCVHHGNFKSTSQGVRPKQTTLRKGCPSKIRFTVSSDGKQLAIVELNTEHTHPMDEESFRALPQKRRLSIKEREEVCYIMAKKGKKSAQKHLKEMGKEVKMRDLHNLVASSRQQTLFYTNIQAILDYLSETEDQSSVVEVVTKADGKIVGIYYQDQEMKRVYASYPQHLIVDATCKFNNLKMPLYVMLVEDGNGDCEIVAIFIVLSSTLDSVLSMVLRFKEHNPSWNQVQVIMADHEFTERRVLEEEFPTASVQICLYHVLRSFQEEISKERMGLEKHELSHCLKLMQILATSKSEAVYMENYKQLQNSKLTKVIEYYNYYWHTNLEEWVEGMKSRTVALKAEAPKKLEFVDKLLKDVFKNSPSAAEFMFNLKSVTISLREERDRSAAALLAEAPTIQNSKEDSTLSLFECYVTPFARKHILRQFKLSWHVKVKSNTSDNSCSIKSSKGVLDVDLKSCPCHFFRSLNLPCRHLFAVRRFKGLPLFDKEVISSRWSMEHYKSSCRQSPQNDPQGTDIIMKEGFSVLSCQERHAKASIVTEQLAATVAEGPVEKFGDHLDTFKKLLSILQKGSMARVIEATAEDGGNLTDNERGSTVQQMTRVKVTAVTYEDIPVTRAGRKRDRAANAPESADEKPSQDKVAKMADSTDGDPFQDKVDMMDVNTRGSMIQVVEVDATEVTCNDATEVTCNDATEVTCDDAEEDTCDDAEEDTCDDAEEDGITANGGSVEELLESCAS